jgi:hypothetical protein
MTEQRTFLAFHVDGSALRFHRLCRVMYSPSPRPLVLSSLATALERWCAVRF